jgi:hypothetical protein
LQIPIIIARYLSSYDCHSLPSFCSLFCCYFF